MVTDLDPASDRLADIHTPSCRDFAGGTPTISVVLADDHELVRRNVRALLDAEAGIDVVADASRLDAAIRLLRVKRPHVLVLDPWMPGSPGLTAIRSLRIRQPNIEIVVMTMHDDLAFVERSLEEGAVGFVVKELAADELASAVRAAARGERYVSPSVEQRLRARAGHEPDPGLAAHSRVRAHSTP